MSLGHLYSDDQEVPVQYGYERECPRWKEHLDFDVPKWGDAVIMLSVQPLFDMTGPSHSLVR